MNEITDEEWAAVKEVVLASDYERAQINNPRWDEAGYVHDWRHHVPEYVEERWDSLDKTARLCVFVMAQEAANNEEWD